MENLINTETSIMVYRIVLHIELSLKQFIFNNPNCICTCKNKWRCTYHGSNYSMNIFIAKKLKTPAIVCMLFTKPTNVESFFPEFKRLFGASPDLRDITFVNRVEKIYTPFNNVYLEGLYEDLNTCGDIKTFFILDHKNKKKEAKQKRQDKILKYEDQERLHRYKQEPTVTEVDQNESEPLVVMDLQRFCALMVQPFPHESNVMIEIFTTGVLNAAGIPNEEYFSKIKHFVQEKLLPLMSKHTLNL